MKQNELLQYISETFEPCPKMWRLIARILDYVDESNYKSLKEYLEDCKWLID